MSTLSAPAPKKTNKIWIIVIVLLILCCLCSLVGIVVGYFYFQKGYSGIGGIFDPLVSNVGKPGDEVRCEAGGYALKIIPGYGYTPCWDTGGVTSGNSMLITDEIPDNSNFVVGEGPEIIFDGFVPSSDLSFDDYVKNGNKDMRLRLNATISGEPQVTVAGLMGVAFDYDYELSGVGKMKARDISVEVNSGQFFMIQCRSTIEKWDKMLSDCNAVINSVTFFEPQPSPTQTP